MRSIEDLIMEGLCRAPLDSGMPTASSVQRMGQPCSSVGVLSAALKKASERNISKPRVLMESDSDSHILNLYVTQDDETELHRRSCPVPVDSVETLPRGTARKSSPNKSSYVGGIASPTDTDVSPPPRLLCVAPCRLME